MQLRDSWKVTQGCYTRRPLDKMVGAKSQRTNVNSVSKLNILEYQAVLVGLRWFARERRFKDTRVSVLTDSKVLFYMLGREHSGADRLSRFS